MNNNLLVSIITPVYNGADYLDMLIQSVLDQDYPFIEHIIIDDGSTDDGATVAILNRYPHIRWWTQPNKGQYTTMNEGLKVARGDVVSFISADDLYIAPSAISQAMQALKSDPSLDLVYGKKITIDHLGNKLPVQHLIHNGPLWLYGYIGFISHCTMFIRRNFLLNNALWFDQTLKYNGDMDWIIRIISVSKNYNFIDKEFCKIRIHPNQTTAKYNQLIVQERKIVLKKFNLSIRLYWIFIKSIQWISLIQKGLYILQQKGIMKLWHSLLEWNNKEKGKR